MLSTQYRLRVQEICNKIATHEEVSLQDMIWANKLGKVNTTVATMLRQAQRKAQNPTMTENSLDGFLNALDLGDPDPQNHKSKFNTVDEIADFFKRDDVDDGEEKETWRRRD